MAAPLCDLPRLCAHKRRRDAPTCPAPCHESRNATNDRKFTILVLNFRVIPALRWRDASRRHLQWAAAAPRTAMMGVPLNCENSFVQYSRLDMVSLFLGFTTKRGVACGEGTNAATWNGCVGGARRCSSRHRNNDSERGALSRAGCSAGVRGLVRRCECRKDLFASSHWHRMRPLEPLKALAWQRHRNENPSSGRKLAVQSPFLPSVDTANPHSLQWQCKARKPSCPSS